MLTLKRPMATICFWLAEISHGGVWRLFPIEEREGHTGGSVVCVGEFVLESVSEGGGGGRFRGFWMGGGVAVA